MNPRPRALLLLVAHVALFGFHVWLLQRTISRGDLLLSGLLIVAMTVFTWRILHYWNLYRGPAELPPPADSAAEVRRIRNWILVLISLLAVHSWLLYLMLLRDELIFVALLGTAVGIFLYRIVAYAGSYRALSGFELVPADGPEAGLISPSNPGDEELDSELPEAHD